MKIRQAKKIIGSVGRRHRESTERKAWRTLDSWGKNSKEHRELIMRNDQLMFDLFGEWPKCGRYPGRKGDINKATGAQEDGNV